MIDLTRSTDRTREVAVAIADDQLDLTTPIQMSVREVLHHVLGLSVAFRDAAGKLDGPTTSTPPAPVEGELPDDWRTQVADRLDELAAAWQAPDAWEGMTKAGGVDLPGEVGGLVALDEVLLHGWDLARATGQDYAVSDEESAAILPIVTPDEADPTGAEREGLFGPVREAPAAASAFEQVLCLAGRDPAWGA